MAKKEKGLLELVKESKSEKAAEELNVLRLTVGLLDSQMCDKAGHNFRSRELIRHSTEILYGHE